MRALSLRGPSLARRNRLEDPRRVSAITIGNQLAHHRAPRVLLPGNTAQSISVATDESPRVPLPCLSPDRTRSFPPVRALHRSASVLDFFFSWCCPSPRDTRL